MAITQLNNTIPNGTGQAFGEVNGICSEAGSMQVGGAAVDIAICGMALRLPGGLASPQQLWDFLIAKGDARSRVPESRYNVSAYHSTSGRPGTVATEYGYFLDDSVDLGALDASRFSLSRAELEAADPQLRRLLEVFRESFDDAGEIGFRGRRIGCYVGVFGEDWLEMQNKDPQQAGPYKVDGYSDFMLSNRLSYEMDLRGPSMTVRTACSSALVGLNEACLAIRRGDCEAAIVGGSNLILAPGMTIYMTEKGVLSPEGSCKTFSADADGYARAEGVTAVYIKPLDTAIRDGNPIRAVIRSTMFNHDGKTAGVMHPSTEAQEKMIRRAYHIAGITDFSKTAFVECHGTGTSIGDPIEANAVARVFGDQGVYIGSVKPNLGHSEGASGLTSLIKAVLTLENRTIVPNIKFSEPNPKIPFKECKLTVPLEPTPWPESCHERVSVNSFGIGGSNAHAILDSARSFHLPCPAAPSATKKGQFGPAPRLLLFSANSASSLQRMTHAFHELVETKCNAPQAGVYLENLAYTLANRREHLPHRAFMVARSIGPGVASPGKRIASPKPNLVMVFTGQGAQWPRMGRELLIRSDLCFQKSIRSLDQYLRDAQIPITPPWTLEEELLKPAKTSSVHTAELSQPLCTAVQIALVDMFSAAGVEPHAVVGHSSGEIAAAYAAKALTAREAIIAAWQRGLATKYQTRAGAMAAIGLSWDEVRKFLSPNVIVACENSPKSVTLSGDAADVEATVSDIRKAHPEALARMLKVDKAYHSYHMREIGEDYSAAVQRDIVGKPALKPFFSSVTGDLYQGHFDASYWQKNLESPVLFRSAVSKILNTFEKVAFLEVGPHSALAGPVRQILTEASSSAPYMSAMARSEDSAESFLTAIGKLFELNITVDFGRLMSTGRCLPDLPRYSWDHDADYWRESRISNDWRRRQFPSHPLLGIRQLESTSLEPSWRNLLHVDKGVSWLRDHRIDDNTIFPAAGYIAMAGEGMRQLSEVQHGFTLRHVVLSAAMVLAEGVATELVTTFRPHRLTDSLDSQWWEFTIASYNGHLWTKHCTGQVSPEVGEPYAVQPLDMTVLPRELDTRRCYDLLRRAGLLFGPLFQRLRDLRSGTLQDSATANLSSDVCGDEEHYHLHPTAVDAAIQLAVLATLKGEPDERHYRKVPTKIGKLTIKCCAPNVDTKILATATRTKDDSEITGQVKQIEPDGNVVLQIDDLRLSKLHEGETAEANSLGSTGRLTWGPHIDFLDAANLIRPSLPRHLYTPPLDELGRLCMLYSHRHTKEAQTTIPHMQKYQAWIRGQVQTIECDKNQDITALNDEDIMNRVGDLVRHLSNTPVAACAIAMQRVVTNISGLLSGETEALDILLADNILYQIYVATEACERSEFIRNLGHSKPNLRVLEIGAGTGASTMSILKYLALPGPPIQALYSKYVFTDISAAFFVSAKELLKENPNIEYRTLDISKDPSEQGFGDEKYDLVIATNVLHATKCLGQTLRNVCKLLAPDGRLLLHEIFSISKWPNFVFGTLPGWWLGESDGRPDEPYVAPTRWESELTGAGFAGLETVVLDGEEPYQLNAIMVARPQADSKQAKSDKNRTKVTLVHEQGRVPGDVDALSRQLQNRGYSVSLCHLGDALPQFQDVITLLDCDRPFFEDIDEARFKAFQGLLDKLGDSGMLWVTRPCHIRCHNPKYAQIIGAARAIRNETLLDIATCEVDDIYSSLDRIVDVFVRYQEREEEKSLKPDFEYAIVDGVVNVGRIYPFLMKDELMSKPEDHEEHISLNMAKPGRLESFQWTPFRSAPLDGDNVEVKIYAAGLNFKDVLCALGVVPFPEDGLGLEASGIVCRVGPEVKDLRVGDRIVLLGNGTFSTHAVACERHCEKIPDTLTFEDAVSIPTVFTTAAYCLFNIGKLQKGQTVLIHSACGGVGLAAIQLAKMVGADIYATVGSEEKVRYLTDVLELPPNRIFNSRDTSFMDGVMRETHGKGVDLALNSLSGELLHATWRCVAEFGTLVEIGKRDHLGAGRLDMEVFLASRTYSCIDLDEFKKKKKDACKELLQSVMGFFKKGYITPLRPITQFDASSMVNAFRHMQQGQHIGKIIISIRDTDGSVKINTAALAKRAKKLELDKRATYLLVGGLGGLGRSVSRYLVEHNARRLIFLSRSAGEGPSDAAVVRELESMGCEVCMVKGSVTSADDVTRVVQQAGPALKGILQCAMVLRDEAFSRMSLDQWNVATAPKVRGTWLLHEATQAAGINLDFFVFFSSMSGTMGTPGQANYAGANTFLDAFVQYRTGLGLAASSINIGPVMDIGYVALNDEVMQRMKQASALGVSEPEFLDAISVAIMSCSSGGELVHKTNGINGSATSGSLVHTSTAINGSVATAVNGSAATAVNGSVTNAVNGSVTTAVNGSFTTAVNGSFTTAINGSVESGSTGFVDKHTFIVGLGTTIPLNNPKNSALHRKDRRMAIYHNDNGSSSSTNETGNKSNALQAFLAQVRTAAEEGNARALLRADETVAFLAREIGRQLFALLLQPIEDLNTTVPLSELGMDSLVSVEMRSWWRQVFGFDITVLTLLGMGNLDALGSHAAEGLGKALGQDTE